MDGYTEPHVQPIKSSSRQNIPRCRNSITSTNEEHPHIGNYRLLKTIGKGNFAKVKLARHVLTGREVSLFTKKKKKLSQYFMYSLAIFIMSISTFLLPFSSKEPHFYMSGYLMFVSLLSLLTCLFFFGEKARKFVAHQRVFWVFGRSSIHPLVSQTKKNLTDRVCFGTWEG